MSGAPLSENRGRRRATDEELRELERLLAKLPGDGKRFRKSLENAVVTWAACSLQAAVIWGGIAWVSRRIFDVEFGWSSPVGIYLFGAIIVTSAIVATISTSRRMRDWTDYRPLMRADLDAAEVFEERIEFVAAKWYQEQEHGGIIWCLRTPDDRTYIWYDYDSVHLSEEAAEAGKEAVEYSFRALSQLRIVRAVASETIISEAFSGTELPVESTNDLLIDPRRWPEDREYFSVPWAELDDWATNRNRRD